MRRSFGRARSRGVTFGVVVGALALTGLLLPGAAAPGPTTKFYSATFLPAGPPNPEVAAGSTTTLTIEITNCGSTTAAPCTPSTQSLGSANVTFPAEFTSLSIVSQTPPGGKTWNAPALAGNTVQLRNPGPSNTNALSPGQSLTLKMQVTAPSAPGVYCLTTRTKQSNDFNGTGNDFTRVGSEPCVTVVAPGNPSTLTFVQQPTDTLPNQVISLGLGGVKVQVKDQFGNLVPAVPVSLALCNQANCPNPNVSYGSGAFTPSSATTQTTDATGVATFGNLSIGTIDSNYRLRAASAAAAQLSGFFNIANTIVACSGSCPPASAADGGADVSVSVSGSPTGTLSITLEAAPGSFGPKCAGTPLGDLVTINPSLVGAGTIEVTGTLHSQGGNTGGVPHYTICKNKGPGTEFHAVPLCSDVGNAPPCLIKLNGTGTGDLDFRALITPTDPSMGGGH
jgi:hypothetical protein